MSLYRFIPGSKRGSYSVWRGETWLGYITKIAHRHTARGATKTIVVGWLPSTGGGDLAPTATRKTAAEALWRNFQRGGIA